MCETNSRVWFARRSCCFQLVREQLSSLVCLCGHLHCGSSDVLSLCWRCTLVVGDALWELIHMVNLSCQNLWWLIRNKWHAYPGSEKEEEGADTDDDTAIDALGRWVGRGGGGGGEHGRRHRQLINYEVSLGWFEFNHRKIFAVSAGEYCHVGWSHSRTQHF